jgi:quercetin dioxygenase-like cupin family protein
MTFRNKIVFSAITAAIPFAVAQSPAGSDHAHQPRVRSVFVKSLPQLNGNRLKVSIEEVTYPPAGFSHPHSHPCPVVGYVVEGALRFQVEGEPERTYSAGESFYEDPNKVHQVSANGSTTKPAKFIAYFVCDVNTDTGTSNAGGR